MRRRLAACALMLGACAPDLGANDSLVTAPRILAIRADPAEVRPGTAVTFTPLAAGPGGTIASPSIAWSFCDAPAPLTENTAVATACLQAGSLLPIGTGPTVTRALPASGCSLFGPDVSSATARPQDPDVTGGYYQPVRADLTGASATFAQIRIACDLAGASARAATSFAMAYTANQNPTLLPVTATVDDAPASLDAIPAGARVTLTASWPPGSAETYAWYDAATDAVTTRRESMQVGWYTSAGGFDAESTGRAEDDVATSSANTWAAPEVPGPAVLWIVLRDGRGGVDFVSEAVTVLRR